MRHMDQTLGGLKGQMLAFRQIVHGKKNKVAPIFLKMVAYCFSSLLKIIVILQYLNWQLGFQLNNVKSLFPKSIFLKMVAYCLSSLLNIIVISQHLNWQLGLQLNYRKITISFCCYGTTLLPFVYNKT